MGCWRWFPVQAAVVVGGCWRATIPFLMACLMFGCRRGQIKFPLFSLGNRERRREPRNVCFFFYTRTHLEIMLSRLLDGMHKSVYCLNSWRGCCSVWTDGSEMRIERYIRKREKSCGWAKSNETLKTSVYYSSGSSISFAVRLYRLHQQVIIRFFFNYLYCVSFYELRKYIPSYLSVFVVFSFF